MNIILSAGHGLHDPGAVANGVYEHLHAYPIVWHLRDLLEVKQHSVDSITCFQPLPQKIRMVNELHTDKPVDLALEIHLNSAVDLAAHGTEVLYYSNKSEPLASRISEALSKMIGTTNRGSKKRDNLGWLKQTHPPALIIEVCFISNVADAAIILRDGFHQLAAKGIASGI